MIRSAIIEAPGVVRVERTDDPTAERGDAIVRVMHATICGSDLKIVDGTMDGVAYPLVPGHEWVGEVVDVGPDHRHLLGKTVVSDLLEHCGGCTFCRRDLRNLCNHLSEPGLTRPGAFAEYVCVRASNLIAVPADIPAINAPLIEPLAVALYALRRLPVAAGQTVAVIGAGGIGQLVARAAAASGTGRIGVIDPHAARRSAVATVIGAATLEPGPDLVERWHASGLPAPDIVFEASGDPAAFSDAIDLCDRAGRIGVIGYAGQQTATIQTAKIMTKLLSIHGVLSPTGTWWEAIEKIVSGAIALDGLVTHAFPLGNIHEALDVARTRSGGAIRVRLNPHDADAAPGRA